MVVRAQPPVPDAPSGRYAAISVGGGTACALTEAGEAVCWDIVSGEEWSAPPGRYRALTTRDDLTCAVTDEGGIVCWTGDGAPVPENWGDPSRDAPPGRYTALAMTTGYACTLTEAGEAVCWKEIDWFEMPDPPPGRYVAINMGYFYFEGTGWLTSCAVREDGALVCWEGGLNNPPETKHYPGPFTAVSMGQYRECGLTVDGELTDVEAGSCPLAGMDDSLRYVDASLGEAHACAITVAGAVVCVDTELPFDGRLTAMTPPEPSPDRFAAIGVGFDVACALTESGRAVCWRSVEVKVERPDPPPGRYVAVSDGYGHTCALTDAGEAVCWGWSNYGQADVPPGRYTAIGAGYAATCALTEEGEAVCWGDEYFDVSPGAGRYTAISVGYHAACALTDAGEAVCWPGWDVPETLADAPPGPFIEITLSWDGHACALRESGEAVCWGRNNRGQADVPPGRYTAISAGIGYTCAVEESGAGVCWGGREYWRWPEDPPPGRYTAISAGSGRACALTDAGEARCWGRMWDDETDHGPVALPSGRYAAISSSVARSCALTEAGQVVCKGDVAYERWPSFEPNGVEW